MGAWQLAHLPRSTSQLTTGMFCSAVMGALHLGQAERGMITLNFGCGGACVPASSAQSARSSLSIMMGTRWMTTLRKLPIMRPNATQIPMNSAGCAARMARKSANTSGIRYRKTPRPSFRTGAAFSGLSSAGEGALHHRAQFEDGQVHGDHEATDEHAEDGHDERLEQRGHAVHRVVDFRFVEG